MKSARFPVALAAEEPLELAKKYLAAAEHERSLIALAHDLIAAKISIIGDRGRSDTPTSSDGVVPYSRSHLAGGHRIYTMTSSIFQLRCRFVRKQSPSNDAESFGWSFSLEAFKVVRRCVV